MVDRDFVFSVILVLLTAFLSTFVAQNLLLKMSIFLLLAAVTYYGYLSKINQTSGFFYRCGDFGPSTMQVTGVGHRPTSVEFRIKKEDSDEVIAEGLKLSETLKSDERMINGKLFKISLLSLDFDGFAIHLTNETGSGINAIWIVEYSKANDLYGHNKNLTME